MAASRSLLCALVATAVIAAADATFEVGRLPGDPEFLNSGLSGLCLLQYGAALFHALVQRHAVCRYLCKMLLMQHWVL